MLNSLYDKQFRVKHLVLRLLHLTDLHFGGSSYCALQPRGTCTQIAHLAVEDFRTAVRRYLEKNPGPEIAAILLGGDYVFAGVPLHNEFGWETTVHFVRGIRDAFPQATIIPVPGNHDTDHGYFGDHPSPLPVPREIREKSYRQFLIAVSECSAPIRQSLEDPFLSTCWRCEDESGKGGLLLLTLNSCRIERRECAGWGFIGADQLDARIREACNTGHAGDCLLALTHHHLVACFDLDWTDVLREQARRKLSFSVDAVRVEQILRSVGCCCVLFGHTHESRRVRTSDVTGGVDLDILHAGAGTPSLVNDGRLLRQHHFQIVEVERNQERTVIRFVDFVRDSPRTTSEDAFAQDRQFVYRTTAALGAAQLFSPDLVRTYLKDPSYTMQVARDRDRGVYYESWGALRRWREAPKKELVKKELLAQLGQDFGISVPDDWLTAQLDKLIINAPEPSTMVDESLATHIAEAARGTGL